MREETEGGDRGEREEFEGGGEEETEGGYLGGEEEAEGETEGEAEGEAEGRRETRDAVDLTHPFLLRLKVISSPVMGERDHPKKQDSLY